MKKEDKIWTDLERYIQIIRDEIRSDEAEKTTVDFYLFKIERRIKILKDYINEEANKHSETQI